MNQKPIGIMDSGIGGTTVLKEMLELLPCESYIYMADTKNMPYGSKIEEEIFNLACFMIDELIKKDVKLILVACNTISVLIKKLQKNYAVPIYSIIEPTIEYISENYHKSVCIYATEFTVNSGVYKRDIGMANSGIEVYEIDGKDLATIIDREIIERELVLNNIKKNLLPVIKETGCKNVILGCTHYPIVMDSLKDYMKDVDFINPTLIFAKSIEQLLKKNKLLNIKTNVYIEFYTTGNIGCFKNSLEQVGFNECNIKNY